MNIKVKNNQINISHKLKSSETYKINKNSKYQQFTIMQKPEICLGFSSRTIDNKDILCLDYDNVDFRIVKEDISYIQEHYSHVVSNFYIFTTRDKITKKGRVGNYHVISLSKHNPSVLYQIIKNTHVDKNYIDSPLRNKYRSYVLRLSKKRNKPKPKFVAIIHSSNADSIETSNAHEDLFYKYYKKFPYYQYSQRDNSKMTDLFIEEYETWR